MPELPDISAYLEALQPRVSGRPLERVRVTNPFLVRSITPPLSHTQWTGWIELGFLAGFVLAVLWNLRRLAGRLTSERAAWLGYGALALTWSSLVWFEDWGFMRILAEFVLLGTMLLMAAPTRLRVPVLGASLALWLFLARDIALYR